MFNPTLNINFKTMNEEVEVVPQPETKVVKMRAISQELSNQIVNYLKSRPLEETYTMFNSLTNENISPIIDVTFTINS